MKVIVSDPIDLHLSPQQNALLHKMLFGYHRIFAFILVIYPLTFLVVNYTVGEGFMPISVLLYSFLTNLCWMIVVLLKMEYYGIDGIRRTFRQKQVNEIRFHREGINIVWQGFPQEKVEIPTIQIHCLTLKSWKVGWKTEFTHSIHYHLYLQIFLVGKKKPLQTFIFSDTNISALAVHVKHWKERCRSLYPKMHIRIPEWIDSVYAQMSADAIDMFFYQ